MRFTARICILLFAMLGCMPAAAQVVGGQSARDLSTSGLMRPLDTPGQFAGDPAPSSLPEGPKLAEDEPVALEADAVSYDRENDLVVAQGSVELVQGLYVLYADQIVYFRQQNIVQATGNVSMLQPTGDVYFAEYVELTDGMKRGLIKAFSARLADDSVFASRQAQKVNAGTTILKKAVYSPCKLCPGKAPFWQVQSSKVEIDQVEERVYYDNAKMEIMGIPAFYTPFLSHPTPDAAARSGFLTPDYSGNGNLGAIVRTPYYWRISPDRDFLVTPWYTSQQGPLLEGDYNQFTDNGKYRVRFSATHPHEIDSVTGAELPGHEFRGHIYAQGVEELSAFSRVGFDINRTTDDTYIRRYSFGADRVLFSRLYAEAAQGRNYATAQTLAIQGLRLTDDPDTTPLVLPALEGYYETKPYDNNLRFHAFANAQSLTREIGADQRRLSVTGGATLPMISEGGHIFTATANLRHDLYSITDQPIPGGTFDGTKRRLIPQGALEWRYPLINRLSADAVTIEPVILAVAQTRGNNPVEIPNEDNTLIELTDTNLFSINRMPGLDTIDSGSRMAYGFRGQYLFADGDSIDALFGQNYNLNQTPFPNSNTPDEHFSDYVGRVMFTRRPFSVGYRFAMDHETFSSNRDEVSISFIEDWLSVDATYRALRDNSFLRDSEEGIINASLPLDDEWTIYSGARRDLEINEMVALNGGVLYRNECFNLILQGLRIFTRDRDIEPNTEFTFRVGFKNLGEFGDY